MLWLFCMRQVSMRCLKLAEHGAQCKSCPAQPLDIENWKKVAGVAKLAAGVRLSRARVGASWGSGAINVAGCLRKVEARSAAKPSSARSGQIEPLGTTQVR